MVFRSLHPHRQIFHGASAMHHCSSSDFYPRKDRVDKIFRNRLTERFACSPDTEPSIHGSSGPPQSRMHRIPSRYPHRSSGRTDGAGHTYVRCDMSAEAPPEQPYYKGNQYCRHTYPHGLQPLSQWILPTNISLRSQSHLRAHQLCKLTV